MAIVEPRLFRLSADRILAVRVGPRSCFHTGPYAACRKSIYDPDPALIIDVRRGTSIPAAGPPPDLKLDYGSTVVDGDVFVPAIDHSGATTVVLRYLHAQNKWGVLPLPPEVSPVKNGGWQLLTVEHHLVVMRWGPAASDRTGAVLGSDGQWRQIPLSPWGKVGVAFPAPGGVVTFKESGPQTAVALLAISSDGRPAPAWRRLTPLPFRFGDQFAVIGHLMVWRYAIYDLRTGRTEWLPQVTRPAPPQDIADGQVVGAWMTLGGGLFNPVTRQWIPIPISRAAGRPRYSYPDGPAGDRIDEERCQTLGGPENLFQLCDPPKRQFRPTTDDFGTFDTVGPGSTEVLRVIDVAPNRGPAS